MFAIVLTLAIKDWRLFWADRRAACLCFLVPIVLASAFGVIFDKTNSLNETLRLPLAIVVEDDSTFTQAVVDDLVHSPRVDAVIISPDEVQKRISDRRPAVAVLFPTGFEQIVTTHRQMKPEVRMLHHPLSRAEALWAEGLVAEVVMKRLVKTTFGSTVGESLVELPYEAKAVAVSGSDRPFNSYSHSFNGMAVQYLLFWGMESGLLLLRERSRGVWRRTRTAPVSLTTILLGKSLATAGIALLQITFTFTFGRIVFGVTIDGSLLGFIAITLAMSALAASTGLLVAALGGTEARARSLSILMILGLAMVGGLWIPAFLLPSWVREGGIFLPTTWAMRGLDASTWQATSTAFSLLCALAVVGFALTFFLLAGWRLNVADSKFRKGFST